MVFEPQEKEQPAVIVSKPNKALAVPVTEAVRNLFPEAKILSRTSGDMAILPHDLASYTLLRRLGFRVPNPMAVYYDWAGGKPYDVQRITCSLLTANPRAYVFNGMGTGKTKTACWSYDFLRENGYVNKALIVAPFSTINFVWARELFATIPHRKVVVLHGTKEKRLKLLQEEADVYVINHDGVKVVYDQLLRRKDIDLVVIDELAVYRNNNDRSRLMAKLCATKDWVWGLTGAPMPNEPTDVWMQGKIITPHTVPKSKTIAKSMLMLRKSEHVWIARPGAEQVAFSWMQPSVRFSLDDVQELPELVYHTIDVPLGPKQKQVYKTLATSFQGVVQGQTITAVNAAAAMSKLLQIAGGWVYSGEPRVTIPLDNDDRLKTLKTLVMGATGKVLVFAPFKHMVEGISKYIGGNGEDSIDLAVVTGDTDAKERDQTFNFFQNTTKYKAIVAHPACMAHGITLTAADTIIWYCPITSLDIYDQANARITRIGQKRRQQIYHLQGTPVEKRIYALLRAKSRVQDMLLELFEQATTQAKSM